jgi:hypothetical protein
MSVNVLQLIHTTPGEYDAEGNEITAPVVTIDIDETPTDDERYNRVRARMLQLEAMQRGEGWSFRSSVPDSAEEPGA